MAFFNEYMHPRNKYFNNRPDFIKLAEFSPEFKSHCHTGKSGKLFINFKEPEVLRCLTQTLLKYDFNLSVDIPVDRLIPTLPLRLNYLHWIEDLLSSTKTTDFNTNTTNDDTVTGIDIGTGASCIYPLLGVQLNTWRFLATELDEESQTYAKRNVENNKQTEKIQIIPGCAETILTHVLDNYHTEGPLSFCMCNPPFFSDRLEAQGVTSSRKPDRPSPRGVCTATETESVAKGGEAQFIGRMIDESLTRKNRIMWFTSMIGKKSTLGVVRALLSNHKVPWVTTTEFCQGRTMRWGIAWSFSVMTSTDLSPSRKRKRLSKESREKPPMTFEIGPEILAQCRLKPEDGAKNIDPLTDRLKDILRGFEIPHRCLTKSKNTSEFEINAAKNTWTHQRRKRRKEALDRAISMETETTTTTSTTTSVNSPGCSGSDDKCILKCSLRLRIERNVIVEMQCRDNMYRMCMNQLLIALKVAFQRTESPPENQ